MIESIIARKENPAIAKTDVKTIYAAIIKQAVMDYTDKSTDYKPSVIRFLRSEWGRSVLDILGFDCEVFERELKRYAESKTVSKRGPYYDYQSETERNVRKVHTD